MNQPIFHLMKNDGPEAGVLDLVSWVREDAIKLGGNVLSSAFDIVQRYGPGLTTPGQYDIPLDQIQSDVLQLSAYVVYVASCAVRLRQEANSTKVTIQQAQRAAMDQISQQYVQEKKKATRAQIETEARIKLHEQESKAIVDQARADLMSNVCAALQEFVNTLKHVSNRLIEELRYSGTQS
jgi:hypothetical protein